MSEDLKEPALFSEPQKLEPIVMQGYSEEFQALQKQVESLKELLSSKNEPQKSVSDTLLEEKKRKEEEISSLEALQGSYNMLQKRGETLKNLDSVEVYETWKQRLEQMPRGTSFENQVKACSEEALKTFFKLKEGTPKFTPTESEKLEIMKLLDGREFDDRMLWNFVERENQEVELRKEKGNITLQSLSRSHTPAEKWINSFFSSAIEKGKFTINETREALYV